MNLTPSRLRRGYGPIYRKLSRCGAFMSNPAKLVLFNLLERLGQNSTVWPKQAAIAEDTALSRKTVNEAISELSSLDFVSSTPTGHGNVYTLTLARLLAWAEHGLQQMSPQVTAGVTQSNSYTEGIPTEEIPKEEQAKEANHGRETVVGKDYPLSDPLKERTPDARVERWLLKEMAEKWGQRAVNLCLKRYGDAFSLWRKALDVARGGGPYAQGPPPATLRQCFDAVLAVEATERRDIEVRDENYHRRGSNRPQAQEAAKGGDCPQIIAWPREIRQRLWRERMRRRYLEDVGGTGTPRADTGEAAALGPGG